MLVSLASTHSTSSLRDQLDVQTSITPPPVIAACKASGILSHTKARNVHWFPLYTYEVAMLLARAKRQSSAVPARALRKTLDVAVLAQLYRGLMLQGDTWAQTTLPSVKQRWYLAAAFLNVNQPLCLSYLFHPCEKSSMTCSTMPLDASVRVPPAGVNLKSPSHVSFQIMKISSAQPV